MDETMQAKSRQTNEFESNSIDHLRETLINRILVVFDVFAIIALVGAQIRAFDIGWSYRDILQLAVVCSFLILTLIRQKLASRKKAAILILLLSIGGFSGFYSLGMLGGTVFIFPTAVVIIAVFYSMRVTLIYIIAALILCGLIAIKFCSDNAVLTFDANLLMSNYLHWLVYIDCIAIFFAVTFATIHNYRSAMKELLDKINSQRDELIKANQELLNAAKNIKQLSGLLPICAYCKKIRNDTGYWEQLETYISQHSEADFSHSICEDCLQTQFEEDDPA